MSRRPIWAASAWGGFVCALLALSSLMHGYITTGLVLLLGTAVLLGWAAWRSRHHH